MPGFRLTGGAAAPVEDVWKLLFDPARFPEWWDGIETVRAEDADEAGARRYDQWLRGHPDVPLPQVLRSDRVHDRITVSCQTSGVDITWQLAAQGSGDEGTGDEGTTVQVRVEVPEAETHRLEYLVPMMERSLTALAALAEAPAGALSEQFPAR